MRNSARAILLATLASVAQAQGWTPVSSSATTAVNSTSADAGPSLSSDGLTMYFSSSRTVIAPAPLPVSWEIYSTTRTSIGAPWGAPVREVACSSPLVDDQPFITADGLELWFNSSRTGNAGSGDIMRMTRASTASLWGAPVFVTELQSIGADSSPTLTDDLNEIYFLSTGFGNPGGNNNSLFVATRANPALPFSPPQLVTQFYNGLTHRDVHVSGNGLEIWYTEFISSISRIQVKHASRLSRSAPFGPATNVTEFDNTGTSLGVYGISVSRDGTEMILDVGYPTAGGSRELQTSRFSGCTTTGVASGYSYLELRIRDGAGAGRPYLLVLSGGNTGFFVNTLFIPVDPDPIFTMTLGVDVPPFTAGFAGITDFDGTGLGSVVDPTFGTLAGITLFATGATIDPITTGVSLIGNAVSFQFQP